MKTKKTISAAVMSLGLVVGLSGFAGATSGSMIGTTGPDSYNKIKSTSSSKTKVRNNNNLRVDNSNWQEAHTGSARVEHNTRGGSAQSGDAENENSTSVSATVKNAPVPAAAVAPMSGSGGSASASIEETGPDSTNTIQIKQTSRVDVQNNNNVDVSNYNEQAATSGEAKVSGNTRGGDATSGSASNRNTTSVNLSVSN